METKIVTIDLDTRSYDIYIGAGLLYRIDDFVPQSLDGRTVFVIADRFTKTFAENISARLLESGARRADTYILPPGENTKSFSQIETLCRWLLDHEVSRNSILFAVGGGVVGDVTGFCASIIMRGISYIQVPTTLLAQVDSSVGGKTGINTLQGKNLVGSFYQPAAVIADIETLKTLPEREFLAGYAELAKYGLINNAGFFNWLEVNADKVCGFDEAALVHAIEVATKAKALIVQADEREEGGQRALLNLGHTFGHALETAAGYDGRLLHGEAVAIGMVMVFDLSSRLGLCPRADYERVEAHFTNRGMMTRAAMIQPAIKTNIDELITIMRRDKKATAGKMKFILVRGIGDAFVSDEVPEDIVRDVIKDSLGAENAGKSRWKSAFSSLSS